MPPSTGRRRFAATLALAPLALAAGCGESGPSGTYLNMSDPNDKVEFLSSSRARITAIVGQPLGVWERGGRAQTEFGRAMQDARKALTRLEQVEVTWERRKADGWIEFSAPGRGRRTMVYNKEADMLDDRAGRKYWKKT